MGAQFRACGPLQALQAVGLGCAWAALWAAEQRSLAAPQHLRMQCACQQSDADQLVRMADQYRHRRDVCVMWDVSCLQATLAAVDMFDCNGVTMTLTTISLPPDDES